MAKSGKPDIRVRRVYEPAKRDDGFRVLVDRVWPRGVKKEDLQLDAWIKEVAPSKELRQWFRHDPDRWDEFRDRYCEELDANPDAWQPLVEQARQRRVTLLFGARDTEHNNAIALREYLESQLENRPSA